MRRIGSLGLAWIAASVLAGTAAAQSAAPAPGTYVYEGGAGTLEIRPDGRFKIDTVGANFHTCNLEGRIAQGRGQVAQSSCVLSFTPGKDGLTVGTNQSDQCQESCGMRATFVGDYIRPAPACMPTTVSTTRKAFKRQYNAKQYAQAQDTLAPVLSQCEKTLSWLDEAWIRNDLALARLRAGDKVACRTTLSPIAEIASSGSDQWDGPPPPDAEEWLRVVRATRTNLKLCS